jgi:hypothetical protein
MLRFSGYLVGADTVMRSWVADVNPNGAYVMNSYPVNYSGNYDFFVTDISNDGSYDYVEAITIGSGTSPYNTNHGTYEGASYYNAATTLSPAITDRNIYYDDRMSTFMAYSGVANIIEQHSEYDYVFNTGSWTPDCPVALYDLLPESSALAGWTEKTLGSPNTLYLKITEFYYDPESVDIDIRHITYEADSITFNNMIGGPLFPGSYIVLIKIFAGYVFDFYAIWSFTGIDDVDYTSIYRNRFDPINETLDAELIGYIPNRPTAVTSKTRILGDMMYTVDSTYNNSHGFDLTLYTTNIPTGETTSRVIASVVGTGTGLITDTMSFTDGDML